MEINLSIKPDQISIVIKDFLKTYFNNSGCKSVVIGLSGGIDSAVTAVLCSQAIGKKNVLCIFLPDETTPGLDYEHQELFVKKFKLSCKIKDITDIIKTIIKHTIAKPNKYTLANIKARTRMILLYEYANMTSSLVCGTSNKSELLVGYFTKYGDGGVDIMPIGDLYKTQVWQLAEYQKIPKEMISKRPTAGLWHDQFDEHELEMTYEKLDKILYGLERKINNKKIADIVGLDESEVKRIKMMRIKSQHKRRSALIPKIGLRTPGYDWRSPIQEG